MKYLTNILISGVLLPINLIIPSYSFTVTPEINPIQPNQAVEQSLPIDDTYISETVVLSADKVKIKEYIIEKAIENKVDVELALTLGIYESRGLNPLAENPNSTAKGIYQFIDGTWEYLCESKGYVDVFNYEENVSCALERIAESDIGIREWTADVNTRDIIRKWVICEDFNEQKNNNCRLKNKELVKQ